MLSLTFLLLAFLLMATESQSFEVLPLNVTHLSTGNGLWMPSGAVTLQEGVICAQAYQEPCAECKHQLTAVCTFDGGKSFSVQQTKYPFCAHRGVVVGGTLHCPLKVDNVSQNVINITVVSYKGNVSLLENEENTTMTFSYIPGEEVTDIEFRGNTLFLTDDQIYLMNAVVKRNTSLVHVLFQSDDGYIWSVRSKIPLDPLDNAELMLRGRNRLMVSTYNSSHHYVVSSGYQGRWWGSVHYVDTESRPAALAVGNGISIESGITNKSGLLELAGLVEGKPKVKSVSLVDLYKNVTNASQIPDNFTLGCDNELPCLTTSHIALMRTREGNMTALFGFVSTTTKRKTVVGLTLLIDDTEEKNERLAELRKLEEEAKQREEARLKYLRDLEEKKQKEREEKLRREQERLLKFQNTDEENIKIAVSRLSEDGEMIVVREVDPDLVDLEKQAFFW
ncbi:hypothetical protein, conserved [Trypanosoma brucei brucei TREU927]|uniref:Uncharacterized protein n=1 Tax=Trypanosoma brucei brucei (strain 927/4 GUTat10.1) TaxID=185431 RepID=Q388J6_TRYB2|nr:hypothetical protein, conserved [Trypanosoma brucei brucei TREU927]EAN78774.1 hypothetical protein, conserved [Trypanosoma brucei brucei TREU927]